MKHLALTAIVVVGFTQQPMKAPAGNGVAKGYNSQIAQQATAGRKNNQPSTEAPAPPNKAPIISENRTESATDEELKVQQELARFTGGLLIVGFLQLVVLAGQAYLFYRQATIMEAHKLSLEQLAKAANDNAAAALRNANALINAERPWVMVQIKTIPEQGSARATFHIDIFNYGKSPAHITACIGPQIDFCRFPDKELPLPPEYWEAKSEQTFLAPKDSAPIGSISPSTPEIRSLRDAKASRENISRDDLKLVAYGLVEYADGVSGKTYRTAFCYRHEQIRLSDMGGRMILCGPREYNLYT
jgi:hypothetical protein